MIINKTSLMCLPEQLHSPCLLFLRSNSMQQTASLFFLAEFWWFSFTPRLEWWLFFGDCSNALTLAKSLQPAMPLTPFCRGNRPPRWRVFEWNAFWSQEFVNIDLAKGTVGFGSAYIWFAYFWLVLVFPLSGTYFWNMIIVNTVAPCCSTLFLSVGGGESSQLGCDGWNAPTPN